MTLSVSQKVDTELGQAPTSQARPRDTDHLRPLNLAARTLSLVEHTLSKFGGDPCSVRRGIAAAARFYVRKASCFSLLNRTREARALCGFQYHKGENPFCFLFSDPIIVGLMTGSVSDDLEPTRPIETRNNFRFFEEHRQICRACSTPSHHHHHHSSRNHHHCHHQQGSEPRAVVAAVVLQA